MIVVFTKMGIFRVVYASVTDAAFLAWTCFDTFASALFQFSAHPQAAQVVISQGREAPIEESR